MTDDEAKGAVHSIVAPAANGAGASGDVRNLKRRMHVVIVDEEFPYPLNSGKRIRTANLVLQLAQRHRITYLAYRNTDPREENQARDFFQSHGIETVSVDRRPLVQKGLGFYFRLFANLFSPLPYSVQTHNTAALRQAIRQYAAANDVDLWQAEWTPYGESLAREIETPWVVMAHNVESLIWRRYFETELNPFKRWYIKRQWKKFERFERRIFSEASQTITVSEPDATLAREQFGASRVAVVDNGVDVSYFCPDESQRDPKQILFLGSLDWRPNLDGVLVLLDSVFPRVIREQPAAQLCIVGRNPPKWLTERVAASPNVELHANVPDVRPFLRQSGALVVPLRIGGGSRLKILEALATECPVISTDVGAEGLSLASNEHLIIVNTPDEMAEALSDSMRDPQPIRSMGKCGRQVILDRYDWKLLSGKLGAVWNDQLNASRATRHETATVKRPA